MILIGLGGNIDGPWGSPRDSIREAIRRLRRGGIGIERSSALVETTPLGPPDQPNFLNAVVRARTRLGPQDLLSRLQEIESAAGRRRGQRWGPRPLDLDLLDYHGSQLSGERLTLPHPELANRPFVLIPIAEIAPRWRHPLSGKTARELLASLHDQAGGQVLARTAW